MRRQLKLALFLLPFVGAGCADFSFSSNVDADNFKEYFKPDSVTIYQAEELEERNYVSIGTVEGESCQSKSDLPPPNQAEARTEARRRVADMGGNGVVFNQCITLKDAPGCLEQIICYGEALHVGEDK